MERSNASLPPHTSCLAQPQMDGPPNIKVTVDAYEHDSRITMLNFTNTGNTAAPQKLKKAALVPAGVPAHILRMMGDVQIYPVFMDSEVKRVLITVGVHRMGWRDVDVLTAAVDLVSVQEGSQRIIHGCSEFD